MNNKKGLTNSTDPDSIGSASNLTSDQISGKIIHSTIDNKSDEPFNLTIKSHPENLQYIRKSITNFLGKLKIKKQDSQAIILALDEVCSNIIRHGYKNDYNKKIDITITLKRKLLTISIIDSGVKFNINSIEPRDPSEIKPGGLGIHIIKEVMDKIDYSQTSDDFNKVTMVKKIKYLD